MGQLLVRTNVSGSHILIIYSVEMLKMDLTVFDNNSTYDILSTFIPRVTPILPCKY